MATNFVDDELDPPEFIVENNNDDNQECPSLDYDLSNDFVGLEIDKLNPCPNIGNAGYIVLDLETDGLIEKKKDTVRIPSINQVAFGPLELGANQAYITNFYIENEYFNSKLAVTTFLKQRFKGYDAEEKCYTLKNLQKRKAVSMERAVEHLIKWKARLYGEQKPIFLIAHNAERFDKIVFEYNLKELELWDKFKSSMHFMGWIDSLHLIRSLPSVGYVLKFPDDTVPVPMKKPFSLQHLVFHLGLKRGNGEPFTLHYAENDVEALIKLLRDLNIHTILSRSIILDS